MLNMCNLTQEFKIIYLDTSKIISSYFYKNLSSIIVFLFCTMIDEIKQLKQKVKENKIEKIILHN